MPIQFIPRDDPLMLWQVISLSMDWVEPYRGFQVVLEHSFATTLAHLIFFCWWICLSYMYFLIENMELSHRIVRSIARDKSNTTKVGNCIAAGFNENGEFHSFLLDPLFLI